MKGDCNESLRQRIAAFPKAPGVYFMKDAEGRVLYVGKAKDLRSRVSSYFQPGADLTNSWVPDICNLMVLSDTEAAVLRDSTIDRRLP